MSDNDNVAKRFAADIAEHQMTVKHDDGLYRHLHFRRPSNGFYWFDLVTWPGSLAIRGDFNGYMFTRLADMFEFFRGDGGSVNPHYWSEKAEHGRPSTKAYSVDAFKQYVLDDLKHLVEGNPELAAKAEKDILAEIEEGYVATESDARDVLTRWERDGAFSDTWEWDLTDFEYGFLWCCHAIVWGIAQYDAARVPAVTS